jgi:hypothetical protein
MNDRFNGLLMHSFLIGNKAHKRHESEPSVERKKALRGSEQLLSDVAGTHIRRFGFATLPLTYRILELIFLVDLGVLLSDNIGDGNIRSNSE